MRPSGRRASETYFPTAGFRYRPTRAIVRRAGDYGAVVMGSHGGDVIDRLFVGNVADKVFEHSPVPVTVVR
ncbi:universal stress protein [Natrinema caseinilyticum]|uniref:universal stress protein n=1 Tax=Natrinema caseinilyticum TaxID=2961570 RepID=UPI003CCCBFB7